MIDYWAKLSIFGGSILTNFKNFEINKANIYNLKR